MAVILRLERYLQIMNNKEILRRLAIKLMGGAALATLMVASGTKTLSTFMDSQKTRVVLYFIGTGNSLYVARQLAGDEGVVISIPQLMKQKRFKIEADEIGIVYPFYGHMPRWWVASTSNYKTKIPPCDKKLSTALRPSALATLSRRPGVSLIPARYVGLQKL